MAITRQASGELNDALLLGASFLHSLRCDDGLWRDFSTLAGLSSDWVTGFIAHSLSQVELGNADFVSASNHLKQLQRPNGGWAYNESVPTDCDSTAWALLSLSRSPWGDRSIVEKGIEYLYLHQSESNGGFSTYSQADRIDTYIGTHDLASVSGWNKSHTCVTAVTLRVLLHHRKWVTYSCISKAVQYLRKKRDSSGLWRSYWWQGPAYGTYHALQSLSTAGMISPSEHHETVLALTNSYDEGGTAFEAAFTLLTVLMPHSLNLDFGAAERLVLALLGRQQSDGSWPTAPILRIPHPRSRTPDARTDWRMEGLGTGVIVSDQCRSFTTAAVLWALAAYRSVVS